jgi:hypothetical protein
MTEAAKNVIRSWVVGRQGVDTFRTRCLELGWVFHETIQPQQPSLGKDGYLEFTKNSVFCVAVQIEGGRSLCDAEQYELKAIKMQRKSWKASTVPVFGIVWDPDTNGLFWSDITGTLCIQGERAKIYAPTNNELNSKEGAEAFFKTAIAKCCAGPLALKLASDNVSEQVGAIDDILAFGKYDPRYYILLRRMMFGLRNAALDHAICVLGKFTFNYDVYLDKLWFGIKFCEHIRRHFRWTVLEVVALLSRIQDDGVYRATFGQNIYWLIVGDNEWDYVKVVQEATILAAAIGNKRSAAWGSILTVYWAGEEGEIKLNEILELQPKLKSLWSYRVICDQLKKNGKIEMDG